MIDHIGLSVFDIEKSKLFYATCLAPLGIQLIMREDENLGFGKEGKAPFWIGPNERVSKKIHIAFSADSHSQVDAFYEAALSVGGRDNGPPGIRHIYHPHYYAAFIFDPDGHNIEAVCHKAEESPL